jgi:sporulation protein YabP
MAEERRKKHSITLEDRSHLCVSGVLEVISFDEEGIVMETECGMFVLKGAGLHIGKLDLDIGEIIIQGMIDSMDYSDDSPMQKGSILGKLFR